MAAAAAFGAVTNPTTAADVVGAILTRWHYIALLAPLALFLLELKRLRPWILTMLFAAITFAAMQGFADLRIRSIRVALGVPVSYLDPGDPLRMQFGILHGVSTILLGLQVVIAVIVLLAKAKEAPAVEPVQTEPVPVAEDVHHRGTEDTEEHREEQSV
ncbi:MAG: hypothetical protein WA208_13310 [Thermoanaerobaculia bacterium]